jgi:hypothetical protein
MISEPANSIGSRLSSLFASGFFRPLARPTASVYVDCAERLAEAADESGQLPHDEARLLIRDVLAEHPQVVLEEDEGGQFRDLQQRAGQFFNKLLEVHWLKARRVSLDEHFVLLAPQLHRLLRLLRDIAEDRPAELKDFAGTLRSLCADLLAEGALDPAQLGPEEMRQTVKDLLDRAGRAGDQMHAVEGLIGQHEAAQRASASARETLDRFLVEFHTGQHMVCYDALQEAGLLPRLAAARNVAQDALNDPFAKQRLAEGLAARGNLDPVDAYAEAERWLLKLERQLAAIPKKQRLIDGRMADFSRLSDARYRYQTEMRGRKPEQVKAFMDEAAAAHEGRTFFDLAGEPGMRLLTPIVEFFWGRDALSRPRSLRPPVDLSLDEPAVETDLESAREEIRRRNINVLTPQRAARFVERLLPGEGARITTEDLRLPTEDDWLDLLAVLAFDRGTSAAAGHRIIRWRVRPARAGDGCDPLRIPRDTTAGRTIERFTVERIH